MAFSPLYHCIVLTPCYLHTVKTTAFYSVYLTYDVRKYIGETEEQHGSTPREGPAVRARSVFRLGRRDLLEAIQSERCLRPIRFVMLLARRYRREAHRDDVYPNSVFCWP